MELGEKPLHNYQKTQTMNPHDQLAEDQHYEKLDADNERREDERMEKILNKATMNKSAEKYVVTERKLIKILAFFLEEIEKENVVRKGNSPEHTVREWVYSKEILQSIEQSQYEQKQSGESAVWVKAILDEVCNRITKISEIYGEPTKTSIIGNSIVLFFKDRVIYKQSFISKETTQATLDESPQKQLSNEEIEALAEKELQKDIDYGEDEIGDYRWKRGFIKGYKAATS